MPITHPLTLKRDDSLCHPRGVCRPAALRPASTPFQDLEITADIAFCSHCSFGWRLLRCWLLSFFRPLTRHRRHSCVLHLVTDNLRYQSTPIEEESLQNRHPPASTSHLLGLLACPVGWLAG